MALDIFLKLAGIKGESTDTQHRGVSFRAILSGVEPENRVEMDIAL